MWRVIVLWLLAIATAACSGGSEGAPPATSSSTTVPPAENALVVEWDGSLEVRVGDVVRVPWSSLDVYVLDINDSRCPAGADTDIVCVWEGTVTVDLRFVSDGGAVVERRIEGIMDSGRPVFGDRPTARFDLVDVTAFGISDDGTVRLGFAGLD